MAAGEMGAAPPTSGDGGSWVAQVTPPGHPRAARDVPVSGAAGGPHGTHPGPGSDAQRQRQRVPALCPTPQPGAHLLPLPPCLFHTQNKPGTTWQIRSFSLLTLCPAPTQILRTILASGQTDTYPHCHGAPQIQPCSPFLSSLTHQLQPRAGLRVPSAQSSPPISRSVKFLGCENSLRVPLGV